MRPDALATLLKLRRRTVEQSRAVLAETLTAQDDAEGELAAAERAIRRETERAAAPADDDGMVEAFAAWLPGGRRRMADAQVVLDHAVAQAAQARAALGLARSALEAAERLAEAAQATVAAAEARREQDLLDDAGRQPRPASQPGIAS